VEQLRGLVGRDKSSFRPPHTGGAQGFLGNDETVLSTFGWALLAVSVLSIPFLRNRHGTGAAGDKSELEILVTQDVDGALDAAIAERRRLSRSWPGSLLSAWINVALAGPRACGILSLFPPRGHDRFIRVMLRR
jgi:hypothetical protein